MFDFLRKKEPNSRYQNSERYQVALDIADAFDVACSNKVRQGYRSIGKVLLRDTDNEGTPINKSLCSGGYNDLHTLVKWRTRNDPEELCGLGIKALHNYNNRVTYLYCTSTRVLIRIRNGTILSKDIVPHHERLSDWKCLQRYSQKR